MTSEYLVSPEQHARASYPALPDQHADQVCDPEKEKSLFLAKNSETFDNSCNMRCPSCWYAQASGTSSKATDRNGKPLWDGGYVCAACSGTSKVCKGEPTLSNCGSMYFSGSSTSTSHYNSKCPNGKYCGSLNRGSFDKFLPSSWGLCGGMSGAEVVACL